MHRLNLSCISSLAIDMSHSNHPPLPVLHRLVLARLNPLLGSVLAVQGAHTVQLSAMPDGGSWPAAGGTVRVEPMKVCCFGENYSLKTLQT